MSSVVEMVGFGLLVPAAVSIGVIWSCWRWLPESVAVRYALAAGLAVGFCAAYFYFAVPSLAELVPSRNRHWMPYLVIAMLLVGAISNATGVWAPERWIVQLLASIAASWLLVPDWPDLFPRRPISVALLSVYLFVLMTWLPPLAERISSRWLLILLLAVELALAATIAVSFSLTIAQLVGIAAATLLGGLVASFFRDDATSVRCAAPIIALLSGGWAYAAAIEPQKPLFGLLVVGASPLVLWTDALLPESFRNKPWRKLIPIAALAIAIAIGIGLVAVAESE